MDGIGWRESLSKPGWRWLRFFQDMALDLALIVAALLVSFALVYEFNLPLPVGQLLLKFGLPITGVSLLALTWRGAHRINARYLGLYDFVNLVVVVVIASGALVAIEQLLAFTQSIRGLVLLPLMFGFIAVSFLSGVRIIQRQYDWQVAISGRRGKKRTLIVGAGDAGELIVREMTRSSHSEHLPVGFVDDDPSKRYLRIHGVRVFGTTGQLPHLVQKHNVDEVVIAIPSANGSTVRRLVGLCDEAAVKVRTIPPVAQVLNSDFRLQHALRHVEIEDLLRREPAAADFDRAREYVAAETVLVTGGGGSIGAELARQIARLSPTHLILFGKGENSVYEIEQELKQELGYAPVCIIGDIRDRQALEHVFSTYGPTVVFHAAAHKHVPLMQSNPIEAVKNNIIATELLCELAAKFGVRNFVYISTDKAVRPSSVMGATKRVGEMIVRLYAQRSETQFAIVRFGNVLGSRGSLIPLLKKQIAKGGPVRLTHPDMTRYFMTIPEAVQLILQAGAMGSSAELFILDMGEPVKIVDLARDLIRLHGLVPGEDIEIQFTGVRPGEKTHEELVYKGEELQPTSHPKIRVVKQGQPINEEWLRSELNRLKELAAVGETEKLRQSLMELAWDKSVVPYQFAVIEEAQSTEPSESA
ncbi:MAG: polysaccharide biosynthesis protein [Armatimonadetes bacterium]|nr:polysaccharide biosynthesis protein [Armatimonadota bacterium]